MKNKDPKAESLFKKKGFYVALYSCLGIVMISAAVFSFSSLLRNDTPSPIKQQAELEHDVLDLNELQPVDLSQTSPLNYLTPEDRDNSAAVNPKATPTARPVVTARPVATMQPDLSINQPAQATPAPTDAVTPTKPPQAAPTTKSTEAEQEAATVVETSGNNATAESEAPAESDTATTGFTAYTPSDPMNWPVVGELVMDFSMNSLIYDKTLNQYRTNDNLCIGAAIGTQVKATADGVVKEITNTREKGNTIVIDHGNGWLTSYSELQDGILVKEGDYVQAGQTIGGIGTPSIYNVLMGSHLQFSVSKDGVMIDPKTVLAAN